MPRLESKRAHVWVDSLEPRLLLANTRLAVIGDFSTEYATAPTQDVANLVKGWGVSDVVTVGDNNYPDGASSTIDKNIGQFYQQYIYPYKGTYGPGSPDGQNHFWPSLGNHDWYTSGARPYLDYFTLPNNERYYAKQIGNVGIFVIDSDSSEPDGTSATSKQATWIKNQMLASTAQWKLVVFHHPPYSSGSMGSNTWMRWPFKDWGATVVFSGHEHDYERLSVNGLTYFVNGLGGDSIVGFGSTISGSQVRYNGDYGAMLIDAGDTLITAKFINRKGQTIDTWTRTATTGTSTNLIPPGATWKYLDNGSNQGTAWRALSFNDSTWKSGPAQLGYGDGDEATIIGYGGNTNNRYVTSYFRRSFSVNDPSQVTALDLQLVRDDGAVVYLNGTEVYRSNMPSGTIAYNTYASTTVGGADESNWYAASINPALLVIGNNVIAVEVHQSVPDSSDLSFDLQLAATMGTATNELAAPSGLSAQPTSATQVKLSWIDTSVYESGFAIERSTDGANYTQIATTAAGATSYTDSTAAASTSYWYRVRAFNATGYSAYCAPATVTTPAPPPPPSGVVYMSDLAWTSATNGWGPVEKDTSVGGSGAGDGRTITLNGVTYARGLGAHAASDIYYNLAGAYSTFISDIGVDDETGPGTVIFQVYADGVKIYDSGKMTQAGATKSINISVAGVRTLNLRVTSAGDGISYDHADWAGARLIAPTSEPARVILAPASTPLSTSATRQRLQDIFA